MLRNIVAVIAGLLTGMFTIMLIESLGHGLFPPQEGIDFNDKEAIKLYVMNLPPGALISVLFAWAGGAFAAGLVTTYVAKDEKFTKTIIVGILLTVTGIVNMISIPHPLWFWIAGILVFMPFTYLGFRISRPAKKE